LPKQVRDLINFFFGCKKYEFQASEAIRKGHGGDERETFEDLVDMEDLTEAAILANIRARFAENVIYVRNHP
jgi:myosin heavy subunit